MTKIELLEIRRETEKAVELYEGMARRAKQDLTKIDTELNAGFVNGESRYTAGELADVRRDILTALSKNKWQTPRALFDSMPKLSSELITRELHRLAKDHRSDVRWNRTKGAGSAYMRG